LLYNLDLGITGAVTGSDLPCYGFEKLKAVEDEEGTDLKCTFLY